MTKVYTFGASAVLALLAAGSVRAENTSCTSAPPHGDNYLANSWRLKADCLPLSELIAYRPSYVMFRSSSAPNRVPSSPAPGHSVSQAYPWESKELKFQLSFKAELYAPNQATEDFPLFAKALPCTTPRIWFAFTQQSNWQIFNGAESRPFRESNYEPEVIFSCGFAREDVAELYNLGISHQSNGRSEPDSRSWWRAYLQYGRGKGDEALLARMWSIIGRDKLTDDNPDITEHLGRFDLVWRSELKPGPGPGYPLQVLLRHNLKANPSREFVQLDLGLMSFGNSNTARLHLQLTSGFGESLIDYNHRQTTLGIGFSFGTW